MGGAKYRFFRWITACAILAGHAGFAAGPTAPADPICRFHAEVLDPASNRIVTAGYRGQVFVEEGSRKLCLQDRTAVSRSQAEGKLVCTERFGAYDVPNVENYGAYLTSVLPLIRHRGFGFGPIQISANPYDHKVGFSSPWEEHFKHGEHPTPDLKYGFVTQGGACSKLTEWALRYAADRLALLANGPTNDPNTTTLPGEKLTNASLLKQLSAPTVIHPEGLKKYSVEELTKAIRQTEDAPPAQISGKAQ